MSVTNETKKRGRPKKVVEVKEQLPVSAPSDEGTKEQARKAVEEILSQASEKASEQTALVAPVDYSGAKTGASSHDNLDQSQEDYIPGTRVLDIQQVPRRIYDETTGSVRQLGLPDDYHYCWVHTDKITQFRIMGYKFCSYNGGVGSGLAHGGFSGTGVYEKTFDNHVRNGDMLLMWVPNRQYEAMTKEIDEYRDRLEGSVEGEIHNEGYRRGIRTFKEVGGVTIYN